MGLVEVFSRILSFRFVGCRRVGMVEVGVFSRNRERKRFYVKIRESKFY